MLAALVALVALAAGGCQDPPPSTPAASWVRTAPEHLGISYEKIKREFGKLGAEADASAAQRRGYLVWEAGASERAVALDEPLRALVDSLARQAGERESLLDFESADGGALLPRDLLRVGLLAARMSDWSGRRLAAEIAARGVEPLTGVVKFDEMPFVAVGSEASLWLIVLPEHRIVFVAVAGNAPLAGPKAYADILASAMHVMDK